MLLGSHRAWLKLQRCKDRFEPLLRLDALKSSPGAPSAACFGRSSSAAAPASAAAGSSSALGAGTHTLHAALWLPSPLLPELQLAWSSQEPGNRTPVDLLLITVYLGRQRQKTALRCTHVVHESLHLCWDSLRSITPLCLLFHHPPLVQPPSMWTLLLRRRHRQGAHLA